MATKKPKAKRAKPASRKPSGDARFLKLGKELAKVAKKLDRDLRTGRVGPVAGEIDVPWCTDPDSAYCKIGPIPPGPGPNPLRVRITIG